MLVIRLGNLRLAITHVGDFKSGGLQTLDETGGTQSSGRALVTGRDSGGAGGSADDGNLPWLPDDLYGQDKLLRNRAGPIKKRLREN
jgi:hypothetical protein